MNTHNAEKFQNAVVRTVRFALPAKPTLNVLFNRSRSGECGS